MVSQKFKSSSLRENIFPWNEFGKNLFSANENLSIEQKIIFLWPCLVKDLNILGYWKKIGQK